MAKDEELKTHGTGFAEEPWLKVTHHYPMVTIRRSRKTETMCINKTLKTHGNNLQESKNGNHGHRKDLKKSWYESKTGAMVYGSPLISYGAYP